MSIVKEVKQLSRGWRWGNRPLPPKSAEPHHEFADFREFPTDWARSPAAVSTRQVLLRGALSPLVRRETTLRVEGLDIFTGLEGPVIFVANHTSHLDTALLLTTLPVDWQRRVTVGAAADYFFDAWWRAVGSALMFATFPIERHGVGLPQTAARLLGEGWSLVMFPEGTRSPDGWARRFRPGAAALSIGNHVPVVPVGLIGSYAAMPRGRGWPGPGRPEVHVRYGRPLSPNEGESMLEFNGRISASVAALIDEDNSDWYSAARRSASGESPAITGPDAATWRRVWESSAGPKPSAGRRTKAWR